MDGHRVADAEAALASPGENGLTGKDFYVNLRGKGLALLELGRKDFLRGHAGLMQGDFPIGSDGEFPQPGADSAGSVENDEDLMTLRRNEDLNGTVLIPLAECGSRVRAPNFHQNRLR